MPQARPVAGYSSRMATARGALKALDFGQVDSESESEPDLERRFVRTADFDRFLEPQNLLILGPKGSGKSALFEMFAKHLPSTHKLATDRLRNVLIATGTGSET
jgi:DNA replication protein DnaC